MKLAIVGSRTITDPALLDEALAESGFHMPELVIGGGASGADRLGRDFALDYNLPYAEFLPQWRLLTAPGAVIRRNRWGQYNARAGFDRNQRIVDEADAVLALWDGSSPGTKDTINRALKAKKPTFIYTASKDGDRTTSAWHNCIPPHIQQKAPPPPQDEDPPPRMKGMSGVAFPLMCKCGHPWGRHASSACCGDFGEIYGSCKCPGFEAASPKRYLRLDPDHEQYKQYFHESPHNKGLLTSGHHLNHVCATCGHRWGAHGQVPPHACWRESDSGPCRCPSWTATNPPIYEEKA